MQIDQIECKRCGGDMPAIRKEKYGYNFCVGCSNVTPKVGRIIVIGQGDHTATELEIVDQETAGRLHELENQSRRVKNVPVELLNFQDDEVAGDTKGAKLPDESPIEDEEEDEDVEDQDVDDLLDIEVDEED